MKINIIIDNKKSWFFEKAQRLVSKIKKHATEVNLISDTENIDKKSDVSFFLSCEKYINQKIREKSKFNIVIHASDLPKGKGMSPTTWQILEGKNEIPVTLFEVSDGYDDGDYYLKDSFKLDGTELIHEWQEKLYICMEKMILNFLKSNKDHLSLIKQKGKETIYKRRGPEDSKLDINKSIKSQFNLLRVVDNQRYPAFFNHKGKKYIIKIYKNDNKKTV
jgi:methionyl-tRNA formyltransferase